MKLHYLKYPLGYQEDVADKVNNGCGTSGWKGKLVPDTIYGHNISEPCKIHDYEYHIGTILDEKEKADHRFYCNLLDTVRYKTKWWNKWLLPLKEKRCWIYYLAVHKAGDSAFFDNVLDEVV